MAPGNAIDARLARALFAPRAVALVGASGDATKNTARPQRYLRKHGYGGRIFPVNPSRKEIFSEPAFASVRDIPETVDHAFIMIAEVEQALEDCAARGVPVASIYSDGFADAGAKGAERQARLVERARALGVRLLGPNSMGVIDIPGRVALTVNAVLEMDALPAGGTSLISHSVGNEADLGVGELVELLADDADTRVILLFLETVRDAARLASAARRAHAAGKPVVAYKLGRSAAGEALARSHTGALAGSDRALDAYFRDCGIVRVDMLETLLEIAPLVLDRKPRDLKRGPRVAVVTTTGGGAATVVDRLGLLGIETVSPDGKSPIVDLTMAATPEKYRKVLEELLAWDGCDAVLAAVGSSAQFHPEFAVEPILGAKRTDKPLSAFFTPHAERSLALLAARGIAGFRTPEACADAFAAYFAWRAPRERPSLSPVKTETDPFQLLKSLGIPMVEQQVARAPDFAHSVPYPVAVKVLGVEHKTEVGGVFLNVDEKSFLPRVGEMKMDTILVQRMVQGLAEAIVGYRVDPVVGPLVLVGAGGTLAEIYQDVALALAPVSEDEAMAMIERVKGFSVLRGYRNLPRGDVEALAKAVAAFSRLCSLASIKEAEINPLIVGADGVVAVDVLVVARE